MGDDETGMGMGSLLATDETRIFWGRVEGEERGHGLIGIGIGIAIGIEKGLGLGEG
jgi:hypothetical protein